jgi:hypothetical protein
LIHGFSKTAHSDHKKTQIEHKTLVSGPFLLPFSVPFSFISFFQNQCRFTIFYQFLIHGFSKTTHFGHKKTQIERKIMVSGPFLLLFSVLFSSISFFQNQCRFTIFYQRQKIPGNSRSPPLISSVPISWYRSILFYRPRIQSLPGYRHPLPVTPPDIPSPLS